MVIPSKLENGTALIRRKINSSYVEARVKKQVCRYCVCDVGH